MTDVTTQPPAAPKFNAEAFAMNIAKAMEKGGQALAAYLQPAANGDVQDKPPNELTELVKTISAVAEYWLSDPDRANDIQTKIGKAYLDLWGSSVRRLAGQETASVISPAPRDGLCRSRMEIEPILRFHPSALSADNAVGQRPRPRRGGT